MNLITAYGVVHRYFVTIISVRYKLPPLKPDWEEPFGVLPVGLDRGRSSYRWEAFAGYAPDAGARLPAKVADAQSDSVRVVFIEGVSNR